MDTKFNLENIENIELSYLCLDDYQELKTAMIASYTTMPHAYWQEHQIETLIKQFQEGQVVIKVNNQIAGCALSIIINYNDFDHQHTYQQITGNYTFNTHTDEGDILYGIEVFIKPEFRGMRLGRRLYDYRKDLCERLNLKGVAFGGRIPNYHKYMDTLSPKDYIDKVRRKEIHDPVLNFQISNDFYPTRVLKNYLEGDAASNDYAVLLKWDNIYYEKVVKEPTTNKRVVRVGLIQWQMRPYKNLD
ncbi:MAG: GNAT family N-acetyltransferase, partial [Arenibacter sp.]|nr:GNAT family N-acetyltransferase [Arenibacter sp.]